METAFTLYSGDLRTKITHLQSGTEIITDAPVDNQGKGQAFSPTDLVAAALGSCMMTIMGIAAKTYDFSIEGASIRTTKVMVADPRRIGEIIIDIYFPEHSYTDKQKKILRYCADNCPVAKSLHPDLKQTVTLHYKA